MPTLRVGICHEPKRKLPWRVRWFGDLDEMGRPRRYSLSFALKRDAQSFQASKQAELDGGAARDRPKDVTLAQLCDRFLEVRGRHLRASSLHGYANTMGQLKAYFGADMPIRRIDRERAERFIATRECVHPAHKRKEKELSAWGRNQHLRLAKAIFSKAVEWGYVKANPFSRLQMAKPDRRPWHHITPSEYRALLAAVREPRVRALYAVMYTGGLRFGEATNLLWRSDDLDFERGRANVRHRPATADLPPFHVKDYERRSVRLPQDTLDLLAAWQGQAPEGCPFMFLTAERWRVVRSKWQDYRRSGKAKKWLNRLVINNVLRRFRVDCRRAGIKPDGKLTVHSLRKSFAQNLGDVGTPIQTLKKLMGHSSVRVLEEYYLRSSDANEEAACNALQTLIQLPKNDPRMTPGPSDEKGQERKSLSHNVGATGFEPATS